MTQDKCRPVKCAVRLRSFVGALAFCFLSSAADAAELLTQNAPITPTRAQGFAAAIGRVNMAGYKNRSHCTGALVAPDKVLTAAHCLRRSDGRAIRAEDIHFLPGAERGAYLAHGRAKCVSFLDGPSGLKNDAAMIHLSRPLDLPTLPMRAAPAQSSGPTVTLAGYPKSRPHRLRLDTSCRLAGARQGLMIANCRAERGMSGGPVLMTNSAGAPEIAGIMVAVAKNGQTLALPSTRWRRLLNAPCARK